MTEPNIVEQLQANQNTRWEHEGRKAQSAMAAFNETKNEDEYIENARFYQDGKEIDPRRYPDEVIKGAMLALNEADENTGREIDKYTRRINMAVEIGMSITTPIKKRLNQERIKVAADYLAGLNDDDADFGKY